MTPAELATVGLAALPLALLLGAVWGMSAPARLLSRSESEDLRAAGGCVACQRSDLMRCERCDLDWDVNDPCPPDCLPWTQDDEAGRHRVLPPWQSRTGEWVIEQTGRPLTEEEVSRVEEAYAEHDLGDGRVERVYRYTVPW